MPQGVSDRGGLGHQVAFSACGCTHAPAWACAHASAGAHRFCIGFEPKLSLEENILLPKIGLKATVTENVIKCSFSFHRRYNIRSDYFYMNDMHFL